MVAELRDAGFDPQWQRVETEANYVAQLHAAPDLILSDFNLPQFNGLRALRLLRERKLDIPFLFVSGTIGDDVAVQALKEGAADYLIKDRLARLGQAVRSALELRHAREELLKTEQQFRQAQKMEAVGRLAGGVAHDFNNLLTVICGYGEILMGTARPGDPSRPMLETIVKAGEQAAMLTRQLLTFSHQHVHEVKQLDINVIVRESEKMLARLIGEDIAIETCLAPTVKPVLADPGHMNQIIMNLAINARDAMPGGGRLRIETANVEAGQQDAADSGGPPPGAFVLLKVTDTGCGMDAATRLRIFEPFFTTKELGKGTGLGLSTVYGIVQKCDGRIEVDSAVGKGTTFQIYFPAAQPKVQTKSPTPQKVICAGGAETILLVEDDAAVRYLAKYLLGNRGYKVLEADSGAAALALVEGRTEPLHLLLTDVIMPEMSGRVLADRLKCIHPETVILFMSGYTGDALTHHRVNEPGTYFLQKPFTPDSLVAKVRNVLEAHVLNDLLVTAV
jgi:signal transduction histidine kinase